MRLAVLAALPLSLAALLAYANALRAGFVFDDVLLAGSNRLHATSAGDLLDVLMAPGLPRRLGRLSFAVNHYLGGLDPLGYHLGNLVLHVLNGLLLFGLTLVIVERLRAVERRTAAGLAFAGTLLWLVHPLQTQAVTYVYQRFTVLCATFFLGCLASYLAGREARGTRRLALLGAAAVLGGAALLTKENAGALPLVLLLLHLLVPRRGEGRAPGGRRLEGRALSALAVAAAGLVAIAAHYLGPRFRELMAADYGRRGFTLEERLLTEVRVVFHYLGLIAWPDPGRLMLDYDYPPSRSLLDPPTTLLGLAALGALLAAALWAGRRHPLWSLAVLWYFANLAIESSVVPLDLVAEHRAYVPSMLPVVALVAVVGQALVVRGSSRLAVVLAGALALALSAATHVRNEVWRDDLTFWRDNARKAPGRARVRVNLGKAWLDRGQWAPARRELEAALALDASSVDALSNLSFVAMQEGRRDEARDLARRALALAPDHVPSRVNLAVLWLRDGQPRAALALLEEARRLAPADRLVLYDLGAVFLEGGEPGRAAALLREAVSLWPADGRLHALLGVALLRQGDRAAAEPVLRKALALDPGNGVARRALAATQGR